MSELVKMSDQFGGLPMDQLIGGPLSAACDAQVSLAKATSDFIETVGFENGKVRMVPFSFEKPEQIQQPDGSVKIESTAYEIKVPFISIVSVPTLQVTEVDVNFMMEVKSSFSEQTKDDRQASFEAEASGRIGPFSVRVKCQGSISSSKETQRKSDNSAKYDVTVKARQTGTPEGLSRVLDILQQSIAPVPAASEPKAA
ncbi:DUF2589 domain-containing protein [Pseudoalteromonas xiamenensis]|jgi:hypothetical protein|uniref:DUF2589 domain-containing protein n=1 Tax=Pseudoalteromonas xiamenensis TaxID=882626 RepID=A0A975HLV5_9GAMM|nr:DUF2589 domain-containing protein [Pseudoalteromonas xiamenensis]QTH70420.1 DUF2589 domain-containing protein [Pseudoalteromonas xiamenensis]WMN58678.1 DUF2589 domain-containing protein [Pseudoalteromonas xiamenensis]